MAPSYQKSTLAERRWDNPGMKNRGKGWLLYLLPGLLGAIAVAILLLLILWP